HPAPQRLREEVAPRVAGQQDEVDVEAAEDVRYRYAVGLVRLEALPLDDLCWNTGPACLLQPFNARPAADYDLDLGIEPSGSDLVDEVLQGSSAPGDEDSQLDRHRLARGRI